MCLLGWLLLLRCADLVSATFIQNLWLYDAGQNPAVNIGPILNSIDLAVVGTSLTIVADVDTTIHDTVTVLFTFDHGFTNKENYPYYALNGNSGTYFRSFPPLSNLGPHTITAQLIHDETNAVLDTQTVNFTVTIGDQYSGPFTGFTLINTITNQEMDLPKRVTLDQVGTALTIVAQTKNIFVDDVAFWFDGTFVGHEHGKPWAIGRNAGTTYFPYAPLAVPGNHTILAVAFVHGASTGILSYNFTVVDKSAPVAAPIPVLSPVMRDPPLTQAPSISPTASPTTASTSVATNEPTGAPFRPRTRTPSDDSSLVPTEFSTTGVPSRVPTLPTNAPSTIVPSVVPTQFPTTQIPSPSPPISPEDSTIAPTNLPSSVVSSLVPTQFPTTQMLSPESSTAPTTILKDITIVPTTSPSTSAPNSRPTVLPTNEPTRAPTSFPTNVPVTQNPALLAVTPQFSRLPVSVPVSVPAPIAPIPQVESVVRIQGELRKWHKITLALTGPFASETDTIVNPFMDFRLDVTFLHPATRKQYVVPGYFAGDGNAAETSASSGNQWHCHFAPDETGLWNYEIQFVTGQSVAVNDGGAPTAFDGERGSFLIAPSDKTGRDHRGKGRLRYVGMHHLQFAEGEWYLKAGVDSPENFLAYKDFDNTPNYFNRSKTWGPHKMDYEAGDPSWQGGKGTGIIGAINYLSNQGLNSFSFLTMNIGGDDENVFPYISDSAMDRMRMDVSKLAQWEVLFEHADRKGMLMHVKLAETENDELLDDGLLGNERKLYYRELIARFSHHLALQWNLAEEINNPINEIKAFADYIKATDPYKHIIVWHTMPNDDQFLNLTGYPNIDGVSIQDNPSRVFENTMLWTTESAKSGHKWIVSNDEQNSAFEGVLPDRVDPNHDNIREKALWGNIMAGGTGVEYYFGYGYENSDLTCEDFRSRANMWRQSRSMLRFFRDNHIAFWEMANDNSRIPDGSDDWVLTSSDGHTIVVYRRNFSGMEISMQGMFGRYTVQWYNPREGGSMQNGSYTTIVAGGNAVVSYGSPPDSPTQDWVVLIQSIEEDNRS